MPGPHPRLPSTLLLTAAFIGGLFALPRSAPGFTILGSGTSALLGGDLTDPENNGIDGSGANFNWVTINASSENSWTAEGAFNIFDNQVDAGDAKWCCDPAPQWIAVQLDRPYVLTHFTLSSGNDAPDRDPTRWLIEGSNNGTTWEPIYNWNTGVSVFAQRFEVIRFDGAGADFPAPAPYSWFRYRVVSIDGPMHQINELELFGVPTIVINGFTADKLLMPPGEALTLTWDVNPAATSVTLSGVGNVTAQTVNGHGSITLDPGPAATTVYTLQVVHPDTTGQETITVTVTNQPIIHSFAATPPIIGPGGNSLLTWSVFNTATLSLDGTDVTGTTSRTVSPGSNTTYTLTATNPQGSASSQATVNVVEPGVPAISEFMADNDGSVIVDGDGDPSDWIEIHNPSGSVALLDGYFLTDDPADLQRWAFPAVTLPPGGYVIVFASGKNRSSPGAPLHTNFSLDADGEYLALVKPDGATVVSEFGSASTGFPPQNEGVSFGWFGLPPQAGYFTSATPAAANSGGFTGYVADTKFSVNRGFYSSPQTLAITTATPGAAIRFTTDGSWPSETSGTVYASPITVSRTTPVRAIAYKDGHRSTNVDTHTYIFIDDVLTQTPATTQSTWGLPASWGSQSPDYGLDSRVLTTHNATIRDDLKTVPTLSVVLDTDDMFGSGGIYSNPNSSGIAWERATSLELIDPSRPDGTGDFQLNCGIRIQGGAFRGFGLTPKKSFRTLFKGIYGPTKLRFPLFGSTAAREFDTLVLRAEANDGYQWGNRTDVQYARDEFGRRSALDLGIPSARGRHLNLYINGVYWGVYNAVERPDSSFGEQYFGANKEEWDGINFGTATNEGSTAPWNTMVGILAGISNAASEPARTAAYMRAQGLNPDGSDNPAWSDYLNVENYIDYLLVNWYIGNADWPHRNYYTGRERDVLDAPPLNGSRTSTGMHYFMWDAETSMLLSSSNDKTGDTSGVCVPYGHLRNSLEFRVLFGDRAHRALFYGGALTPQPSLARYNEITIDHPSLLIPELARWGDQHGTLRTLQNWLSARDAVRNSWISTRTPGFISVLRGAGLLPQIEAPVLSQRGGSVLPTTPVTLATNANTLFYTLDGTDPRRIGGQPNPAAQQIDFTGGGEIPVAVTFMNTGHVWKYLDNGSNQGTAWRTAGFNDTGWTSGPSSLGYGADGEASGTTVGYGPDAGNRYPTTYFRTTVTIPDPSEFLHFLLRIKYDDGAAVYVNGTEVVRTNLAPNAAAGDYSTDVVADESSFKDFIVPVSAFSAGVNVIAAEIHQASAGSSDIRLDMFLRGEVTAGGATHVSNPIFFAQPVTLRTRAFDSTTGDWSPLEEAFFSIDTEPASAANLVVSELMYRPAEPSTDAEIATSTDRDDFEFIELTNIGDRAIDLTGVRFVDGILFDFSAGMLLGPGARTVVVKNLAAFHARYPAVAGTGAVAGAFASGNLSNDGDRIWLTGQADADIRDFVYDDTDPWPSSADGAGASLVLIAPESNPDHAVAANWRASAAVHGTPGGSEGPNGYAAWKLEHGVTDDQADPDQDGLSHFAEFALGTPPDASSATAPVTPGILTVDGADYASIAIRRSSAAMDDVLLAVETSPDLVQWNPDAILVGASPGPGVGFTTITFRAPQPLTVSPRVFFRAGFQIK